MAGGDTSPSSDSPRVARKILSQESFLFGQLFCADYKLILNDLGEEVENFDAKISRSTDTRSVAWDGFDANIDWLPRNRGRVRREGQSLISSIQA
jgi:hypothetical protein